MNRPLLAFVSTLGVLSSAACTPTRSTVLPPYDLDGKLYSEPEIRSLAVERCESTGSKLPANPFTTDGCTMWFDSSWQSCCLKHDLNYWCGGTTAQREGTDRELRACVSGAGHPGHAGWMFHGVRIFAQRLWPFPWRWGYGHAWPFEGESQ